MAFPSLTWVRTRAWSRPTSHWRFCRWWRSTAMASGWMRVRTFAERRDRPGPPWLAGAAYAFQQVDALHARDWDVALDAICTESDTLLPAVP